MAEAMNLLKMPGCVICGKTIRPWQKVRTTKSTLVKSGRISCHASCYDRRLRAMKAEDDEL